eukprot:10850977-Lingulodinium_polyedra.AAC.1
MTGEQHMTDSGGLLVVGGFVTCTHGAFPVRRALTLPCEVLAVVLCALRGLCHAPPDLGWPGHRRHRAAARQWAEGAGDLRATRAGAGVPVQRRVPARAAGWPGFPWAGAGPIGLEVGLGTAIGTRRL